MKPTTEKPSVIEANSKYALGLHGLELGLVLAGLGLIAFSIFVPISMGAIEGHVGRAPSVASSYLRALTPLITNASMASSFIVAAVILSFENSKANSKSVFFSFLTLLVFSAEISLSLYLSLVRPPTVSALPEIYVLIGLVPLGLGCSMFTLASMISIQ